MGDGEEVAMPDDPVPEKHPLEELSRQLAEREERRRRRDEAWFAGFWSGLRVFGRVGWTIVTPGLAGAAAGIWLDRNWPVGFPLVLVGLGGGTILGCLSAWTWLSGEQLDLARRDRKERDDGPRS